jgi:hypothetical protein
VSGRDTGLLRSRGCDIGRGAGTLDELLPLAQRSQDFAQSRASWTTPKHTATTVDPSCVHASIRMQVPGWLWTGLAHRQKQAQAVAAPLLAVAPMRKSQPPQVACLRARSSNAAVCLAWDASRALVAATAA